MPDDDDLTKAIHLIKTGKIPEAQLTLEPFIQAHPHNIRAWMWETELFPNASDKARVLEICLEHNPDHPQVVRALKMLQSHSGYQPAATAAPPPAPFYPTAPAAVLSEPAFNFQRTSSTESVPSAAERPAPQKQASAPVRAGKHPDWPTTEGVVNGSQTNRQLKNFKEKPEVRQKLSKRYRSFMLAGIGWIAAGAVATVIGRMLSIPLGVLYIIFTGAIAFGIISFLVGLVGWMWYWD